MKLRLSKSKINTYLNCPFLYKLLYVDKVEMPITPYAMSRGVDLHKVFEIFFKNKENTINDAEKKTFGMISDEVKFAVASAKKLALFLSPDKKMMPDVVMTEEKIYCENLDVVGIVDAVFSDGETNMIIDYKSGKVHPLKNYLFELSVYKMLIEKKKKINVDYYGIYFIDAEKLVYQKADNDEDERTLNKINMVKTKIINNEFPKKVSKNCRNCIAFINGVCDGKA